MILGVTGHRKINASALREQIESFFKDFYVQRVNIGMALGFDMLCAQLCVVHKIPFHAYVPYEGQDRLWTPAQKDLYRYLLTQAEQIIKVSAVYSYDIYYRRNKALVNASNYILAYLNNEHSGTAQTVRYALSTGKPVYNLGTQLLTNF